MIADPVFELVDLVAEIAADLPVVSVGAATRVVKVMWAELHPADWTTAGRVSQAFDAVLRLRHARWDGPLSADEFGDVCDGVRAWLTISIQTGYAKIAAERFAADYPYGVAS